MNPTTAEVLAFWFHGKHPDHFITTHDRNPTHGIGTIQIVTDPTEVDPRKSRTGTKRYIRLTDTTDIPRDRDGEPSDYHRGTAATTAQVYGFALDIDIGKSDKQPPYPPDLDALEAIVSTDGFPLPLGPIDRDTEYRIWAEDSATGDCAKLKPSGYVDVYGASLWRRLEDLDGFAPADGGFSLYHLDYVLRHQPTPSGSPQPTIDSPSVDPAGGKRPQPNDHTADPAPAPRSPNTRRHA